MHKAFVISVSGSRAGAGKTRLAEKLLPALPNCAAIKVWMHGQKTLEITEESGPPQNTQKDTARFLAAGARRAFLVRGPFEEARAAVQNIIENGNFERILIESNRLALELDSDLSFFVKTDGEAKKEAALCEQRADIVVHGFSENERRDA